MRSLKTDPKKQLLILAMLFVALGIWCIVSGIFGLAGGKDKSLGDIFSQPYEKGETFSGEAKLASPCVLTIKHSVNFIPAGTEYFYLIFSEDASQAVLVRADKNWGDDFDSQTGECKASVDVSGKIKKLPTKAESRIAEIKSEASESGITVRGNYYVDFLSGRLYALRIALGVGFVLSVSIGAYFVRKKLNSYSNYTPVQKAVNISGCVIAVACLIMTVYLLSMS